MSECNTAVELILCQDTAPEDNDPVIVGVSARAGLEDDGGVTARFEITVLAEPCDPLEAETLGDEPIHTEPIGSDDAAEIVALVLAIPANRVFEVRRIVDTLGSVAVRAATEPWFTARTARHLRLGMLTYRQALAVTTLIAANKGEGQ